MHSRRSLLIFGIVVSAFLLVAGAFVRPRVVEQPFTPDENIVLRQQYRLSSTVDESLFVMAQTIDLDAGSRVTGDAAFVGERITINGEIDGDLTVTGKTLTLGADSRVHGDLLLVGGALVLDGQIDGDIIASGAQLQVSRDATMRGEIVACVDTLLDSRTDAAPLSPCGDSDTNAFEAMRALRATDAPSEGELAAIGVMSSLFVSLVLCGLAALSVTLFPRQISHIEDAIRAKPRVQIVTGLMCFLALIGVGSGFIVLLASVPPLGVILLPLLVVLALILLGMILAGLITLTIVFGDWLLRRTSAASCPPLVTAAVGSIALSLLLHIPVFLPFGVFISLAIIGGLSAVAVGAALSTRMGTRPLRQSHFVQG